MKPACSHWILAAAAFWLGCGGADDDVGPSGCPPDCTTTRGYDAVGYELSARFDWAAMQLVASEEITLVVTDAESSTVVLDGAVTVGAVHAGEQPLDFEVDAAAQTVRVDLAPLAPGAEPVTFTVDYTAGTSSALIAAGARDDDPVLSRVVYTDSEPNRGHRWLVEKDDPDDRAAWAVELIVAADEDVIANGARVSDQPGDRGRVVRYEMDQPIPTYLMAFAVGQLVHEDRDDGPVPLAVWHRRGLLVNVEGTLDAVAEAMAVFDELVGPYPWDSYAVVLVPQYGGGMENATITFNLEESSDGNVSFGLNAHELAHQWFGDWVTMRTYDDLWVKEGMATFLAAEATRARRGGGTVQRFFGTDFSFSAGDAIVDETLTGQAKYTSGPYERAAWTIGQIRVLIGEEAFWAGLRRVLDEHALGSIDGEGFLRSFAPALDEATIQKLLAALPQTDVPSIGIEVHDTDASGAQVTFTVEDPAAVLIAPIDVTMVDADGAATTSSLEPGVPLTVSVPLGGYLAPDERGVHPYWASVFQVDYEVYYGQLAPLYAPIVGEAALDAFTGRSAAHQERALTERPLPVEADQLADFYAALDSTTAQEIAAIDACSARVSGVQGDWDGALAPLLDAPAVQHFSLGWAACGPELPAALLGEELTGLIDAADVPALARLEYLISFDYGADGFAPLSALATDAPTLGLRDLALYRLSFQTQSFFYSPVPEEQVEAWKTFFRERVAEATSSRRFGIVWQSVIGLADVEALPLAADALHRIPMSEGTQRSVVCDAFAIAQQVEGAWEAFQEAAQPWDELGDSAAAVLADPSLCSQ